MAIKKKVETMRDETSLHCRTLMRDHEWLVPEHARPELAPPPAEKSKTERFVDKLFDDNGRSHIPNGETLERMNKRVADERRDRQSSHPTSPARTVVR